MKEWNLLWWERAHEDPPGYLCHRASAIFLYSRLPAPCFLPLGLVNFLPLTPYHSLLTVFFDLVGIFCYDAINFRFPFLTFASFAPSREERSL